MSKCECFTLDVSLQDTAPFIAKDKKSILRLPKSNALSLFYPPIMQADPFLFVHKDRLFLFYEEMPIGKGLGVIKMMLTKDFKNWSKPVQITHEPDCHFSFPFVFEEKEEVYMMPETGCDHNIRLYKAVNDDLTEFAFHKEILHRREDIPNLRFDYADSSIIKKDGSYYLFSSYCDDTTYYLELYVSKQFDGEYLKHPKSPICISNKYGRNGGGILLINNTLYRPTQDCSDIYGGQLHLFEITELSNNDYSEHLIGENLIPQNQPFYRDGGHHINFATFKGKTVIATDTRYLTSFLLERIRLKALKLLGLKENKPY